MTSPVAASLLRSLRIAPRTAVKGERSAAQRLIAAGLIEEFGPHYWENGRKRGRMLRLTPSGEAACSQLPKPRSLMLPGDGVRYDCAHEAACIGGFAMENPAAQEAHCPSQCPSRQDVTRELATIGSSLAEMQNHAIGFFGR